MRKILLFIITVITASLILQAQTPEVLNYQGVLKNPDGSIRPYTEATLILEFVQDGTTTYRESHSIQTNANGYFAIHPGSGEAMTGAFNEIDWSITPVIMRSILDNETIAESHLTSVPYALYAQRVKGQDEIEYSIDTISDYIYHTAVLVDNNILSIEHLYNISDTARQHIDSLWLTVAGMSDYDSAMTTRIDTIQLDIDTLQMNVAQLTSATDSIMHETPFFNATAYAPMPQGEYHTPASARAAVPQHIRCMGMVVTYRSDTLNWHSIQYTHNDTAQWYTDEHWNTFSSYGNIILRYIENDSLTRMQIPINQRRQGMIISYYNNEQVINEQYVASHYDDATWGSNHSWIQLLITSRELEKMRDDIARIDTLINDVKKGFQDISTFGAWFYTNQNELFTQAGGIDSNGKEISTSKLIHTELIPINQEWFVTAYGNQSYPSISFYMEKDLSTRIASICDTLTSDEWQCQTFDFSTDEIPPSARYFTVNMVIAHKTDIAIKQRVPITDFIDTSVKYNFQQTGNNFSYIGAYIGIDGRRIINSQMRHTRFISLEDNTVYKVITTGTYTDEDVCPVVVYYSYPSFESGIGYDIGDVYDDGRSLCNKIISKETAPEGATHFIVNWIAAKGGSDIFTGMTTEDAIVSTQTRLDALEDNHSCYAGRKLVTIGDSFTTNSGNRGTMWQEMLSSWLGARWSYDETYEGVNGFKPMGVGGSWVMPNDIDAMSLRCADVKRYNPNVIIVYGGQNDKIDKYPLGSIDDEPFIPSQIIDYTGRSDINSLHDAINYMLNNDVKVTDNTIVHVNASWGKQLYCLKPDSKWDMPESWYHPLDSITFYSAYKGMIEQLCTQNPYATIYCLTLMQCDESRYDQSLGEWDTLDAQRRTKCQAIREIAAYYGVELIDLWNKSGVTPYNAASLYYDWLHPNQYGYRRMAECIYRLMK